MLHNLGDEKVKYEAGTRIAQGIFKTYETIDGDHTCNGKNENTREGGFGSTE